MKSQLLLQLRSQEGWIPADRLTAALECGSNRLEAEIRDLSAHGYVITAGNDGYWLIESPDTPFAWEFPERENFVHYYPVIGSTMDAARDLARNGAPQGTVVVADVQDRGRGRMERTWLSAEGGLYFTLVMRPELPPAEGFKLNFLASLSMVEVLRQLAGLEVSVKWPNDILAEGKKLCGMLSEMDAAEGRIHFINIGIGVNVNNMPAGEAPGAVSLKMLTGRTFSRRNMLGLFLKEFAAGLDDLRLKDVIRNWKKVAGSLNKPVTVVTHREKIQGMAEDVDDEGSLIVRLADGNRRTIIYGDCFHG